MLLPGSSAANWQYLVTPEQTLFRGSDGPRVHGLAPGAADVARLGRTECERAAAEIESASIKAVLSECVDWQSTTALWVFERGDAYAAEKLPARAGLTARELHRDRDRGAFKTHTHTISTTNQPKNLVSDVLFGPSPSTSFRSPRSPT